MISKLSPLNGFLSSPSGAFCPSHAFFLLLGASPPPFRRSVTSIPELDGRWEPYFTLSQKMERVFAWAARGLFSPPPRAHVFPSNPPDLQRTFSFPPLPFLTILPNNAMPAFFPQDPPSFPPLLVALTSVPFFPCVPPRHSNPNFPVAIGFQHPVFLPTDFP